MLTIITASYNSESTIANTIESLLKQTCRGFEYIIVDAASTDSTVDIIKSFEGKFREKKISYRWISEVDKGIYDAWNKGLKMAKGNWISFLGSDDVYLEKSIEIYKNRIMELDQSIDLVYSNVKVVKDGKVLTKINGVWKWNIFKRFMNIAHVGSFHNRRYFKDYGVFDDTYIICGDYELLLRARNNLKCEKINVTTALMDYGGVSNNQIDRVFKETIRAKNKTGGTKMLVCYYDYFIAYLKFFLRRIRYAINR